MKKFTKFTEEIYIEVLWDWVKNISLKFSQKIKSFLLGLGFGDKKRMIFSFSDILKEDMAGYQSYYGYYVEYVCALNLYEKLKSTGLNVLLQGTPSTSYVDSSITRFLSILKEDPKFEKEIKLREKHGETIASKMASDILDGQDLNFIQFNILLTGDSEKGKSKADLVIEAKKDSEAEVRRILSASIKSYKSWNVNLLNSTINSFFNNLGMASTLDIIHLQNIRSVIAKVFRNNTDNTTREQLVTNLYNSDVWKAVENMGDPLSYTGDIGKSFSSDQKNKLQSAFLVIAKETSRQFVEIINKEIKKPEVSKRISDILGFNEDEDFYMSVGGSLNKISAVSSRTSKEYKKIVDNFNSSFSVRIIESENISVNIEFIDPLGERILKGSLAFGKSGGTGQTKINFFVDLSSLKG